MKKIIALVLMCAMFIGCTGFTYSNDVDYLGKMIECAERGTQMSLRRGVVYETRRNMKIADLRLPYEQTEFFTSMYRADDILVALLEYKEQCKTPAYTQEELELLAKIIYAEAGSYWLSDEWKMCVGEVVLNRIASPEFPNTMKEVLEQPGQYYGKNSTYFNNLVPSEKCYEIAQRLLEGERYINDPSVVFQANFTLGSGIALHFKDSQLGDTYFCYSSYPELYN